MKSQRRLFPLRPEEIWGIIKKKTHKESDGMKLNYKRTILVGFAFFLICTFWQAYDTIIPKILTDKFGMSQAYSGIIMAIDNVLALFMLPLFGSLSDKCKSPMGRRTPFILIGTIVAALAFVGLSFVDNLQLNRISAVSAIDDPAAMEAIYEDQKEAFLLTPAGESFVLGEKYAKEAFAAIPSMKEGKVNPEYSDYVVPARQAAVHKITRSDPSLERLFILVLCVVLIAMATFRSPAVALMPDVTVKPLRSKANAVINLMGTAGGILVLVLGMVFKTSSTKNALMSYTPFFCAVAGIMLLALVIFMLTVKEPRLVKEMELESRRYGLEEAPEEVDTPRGRLGKGELRSLLFILGSIVLWFMGYNAVTSKYSVYAEKVLGMDYNTTLLLAQAAAIISYLPVGMIASRVGRKKTILAGILMLTAAFGTASFLRVGSSQLLMNAMFCLAGIGWATINVNSFPMVVEMCKGSDVGKYTGFYYTASMAVQTLTPYLSGKLMDMEGMTALFPYATVCVGLAFVTMLFVRHGDSKPMKKQSTLEAFDVED